MSSTTASDLRRRGKKDKIKDSSNVKRDTATATVATGPPLSVMASIAIGFMTTNILISSMIRLGPKYLEPVYGNVLPYVGLLHGVVASVVVGGILGVRYWQYILTTMNVQQKANDNSLTVDTKTGRGISMAFDMVGILTSLAPLRAVFVFRWSRWIGPEWGPLISHSVIILPVLVLGGFIITLSACRIAYNPQSPVRQSSIFIAYVGAAALLVWTGQRTASSHRDCYGLLLNAGYAGLSSLMIKLLIGYQENVDAADALEQASQSTETTSEDSVTRLRDLQLRKLRFVPIIATVFLIAMTYFSDPKCSSGVATKNNPDSSVYHMLSRSESVTGWVSVVDESTRSLRVLRSGHSLIGGQWKDTGESVFGIFYLADALRLVRDSPGNPEGKPLFGRGNGKERALQIGLGVGVSAKSLFEQNVRVDVVEIDPAVYQAAVDYFDLPKTLNSVNLEDGRQYIDRAPSASYDYIVHDVFTGGSVPSSLFSKSAVEQLHRILRPKGILAMNYVGLLSDQRTLEHVASTLHTSFAHVRCFAETTDDLDSATNMMLFASNQPIVLDITSDVLRYFGTDGIRSRMLKEMEKHELPVQDLLNSQPITDSWNPLPQWQVPVAIQHWKAMRGMLPDKYWLNY